eukprot:1586005-Amphidinium_carterae.1
MLVKARLFCELQLVYEGNASEQQPMLLISSSSASDIDQKGIWEPARSRRQPHALEVRCARCINAEARAAHLQPSDQEPMKQFFLQDLI